MQNPTFLELNELDALACIEDLVPKLAKPTVNRKNFHSIKQNDNETIQEFVIRLKTAAPDCEFSCPNCNHDLSHLNIRDQFIIGLNNHLIQTDILTKDG